MCGAVNGLLRGEFLQLPGVGIAAVVGVTSTAMAIGLQILGFSYKANVITAVFAVAGAGGMLITVIGAVAYSVLAMQMQRGQDRDW
ncbi:MAG: hypothetical protein H0X51_03000 [Parachlamydiaceae bacterium]|nr:hypothetical protein [Parachlamydiaceae bacterium]